LRTWRRNKRKNQDEQIHSRLLHWIKLKEKKTLQKEKNVSLVEVFHPRHISVVLKYPYTYIINYGAGMQSETRRFIKDMT